MSKSRNRKRTRKGIEQPPTRLCCGERHNGALCNDGKVMCCLCFERVEFSELADAPDGVGKEDVCWPCRDAEKAIVRDRQQALYELREKAQKAVDSGAVKSVTIESGRKFDEPC